MIQKNKWYRLSGMLILLIAIFFLTTSCGKEIRDFFKAIDRYGYKSREPISKKTIPVDKQLLGGYVYNSLPVIISQKDELTYKMTFLSVELDQEDVEVEAFMSELPNGRFLNINMGDAYAFLKISMVINNQLPIKLLRNSLDMYVKPEELKSWLTKYGNEETFTPVDKDEVDIYYSFAFNKITVEKAYQIQKQELHEKMIDLFESCKDYYNYDLLEKRYPNEPLLSAAREKIFSKCNTMESYQTFITKFPNDELAAKAKIKIEEIKMYKADSLSYNLAVKQNTIDAYSKFINNSSTPVFKDSAVYKITALANNITENDIEWKWTGSSRTDAINLLFQKIEYSNQPMSSDWYQQHLTFYCLKLLQNDITEKGLLYLDKLAQKNPTKNDLLNLYLSKGFLLWSLDKTDLAIEVFKSKIEEAYVGEKAPTFKKKLKMWYGDLKDMEIAFPHEKPTWKKIKKLK